jgi:flagellar biosynthetic protein FliQ
VQAVTQIQEMSLSFVPKLMTAGICLVVFGPWMLRTLVQFTVRLWSGIPALF